MKAITIRLSDVEAMMVAEVKKRNKVFGDLQALVTRQIPLRIRRFI